MAEPLAEIEVDWSRFNKAIETLHREDNRTIPQLLKDQGRLLGVDLAYNTFPIGSGTDAKRQGELAVTRDIMKVYITASEVVEGLKTLDADAAKGFYRSVQRGNYDEARGILERLGIKYRNADFGEWDGGEEHRAAKNARGGVSRHRVARIIPNAREMRKYTREVAKRVGYSKGSYAAGAAELGTLRSFPGWVKRHAGGRHGGAEDKSKALNNPYVSVYSSVPWIKKVTTPWGIAKAMKVRSEKMEKQASRMMDANLRKAGLK